VFLLVRRYITVRSGQVPNDLPDRVWTEGNLRSNKQTGSDDCGVFVLMVRVLLLLKLDITWCLNYGWSMVWQPGIGLAQVFFCAKRHTTSLYFLRYLVVIKWSWIFLDENVYLKNIGGTAYALPAKFVSELFAWKTYRPPFIIVSCYVHIMGTWPCMLHVFKWMTIWSAFQLW